VCAVEVDDRRLLAEREDWASLLDMAHESRMSVTQLVDHLRRGATT
jgi:predicted DNA-binding ribbon-helix-helix protein